MSKFYVSFIIETEGIEKDPIELADVKEQISEILSDIVLLDEDEEDVEFFIVNFVVTEAEEEEEN